MLCYLTAGAEVVLTYHLPLLVCVHLQEPGRTLSGHVDPPALLLQLLCRLVPARGPSEDTWKEDFQDFPCVMGPKCPQR